jgi:O-antigen/teichoic acid export membrane protein
MIINGIILVPIYFTFMSVSTYGAWLATGNVVAMLGLVESGFSSVVTQKMAVALAQNEDDHFVQLAGANFFTGFLMSTIIFVLGLASAPFVADWVNASDAIHRSITIAFIISLASSSIALIVSFIGTFPQVWQETKTTGFLSTAVNLIGVISLIIYLYLGFGVVALALGYFTRSVLNLLSLGIWVLLKWREKKLPKPTFSMVVIKKLLRDSFYPFLSKMSNVIMGNSQSFIIAMFISPSVAAIYDITSKIAVVGSSFVGMINSSFFSLFSLTFAKRNTEETNNLIRRVSIFFLTMLFSTLLYALIFTKPFIYFWVGLDKYGGDILLGLIILSLLITQLKQYFNNLLYTGNLIDKSAKLDMLSMLLFVISLVLIIKPAQIYALPIASSISGVVFIGLYLILLKTKLNVDIQIILRHCLKMVVITIPFLLFHFVLKINLFSVNLLFIYLFVFTIIYFIVIGYTNKQVVTMLLSRLRNGKK